MIYADYNGSAPLLPEVKEYLKERLENGPFANPNAIHFLGTKAKTALENSRIYCAEVLSATPDQLIFNSGSTEGISTVFSSLCKPESTKKTIVISGIEHPAVFNNAKEYEKRGFKLEIIPTKNDGIIDLSNLINFVGQNFKDILLVAVMAANNETGILQPYQEISNICNKYKILYLCDTTQLIGKDEFDFTNSNVDFAVLSGHKLGALPGSGVLLAKDPTLLSPIIIGGGQEKNYRSGTENYLGIETLAIALNVFTLNKKNLNQLLASKLAFEKKLKSKFEKLVIIGDKAPRLSTTSYLAYPGIHSQAVQIELESQDIFVTTSSACSDNEPVISRILKEMNLNDDIGRGAIRISLGIHSPLEDYDQIYDALCKAFLKLLRIKNY